MNHDKNVTTTIGHLIDGKLVADTERTQPVFNPATGQSTTSVALASKATVEAAIASAEAAFPAWRNTPPLKRARVMSKLKVLLEENADKIAAMITAEHGKVLADAHGELQRGIENVEYASYAPELLKGEHSRNVGPSIDSWSEFQALGVTAGITPFNFPAMVPLWMWPMAVACGNTFVLKPSERDPSSTLFIAQLALEAGLPPGVLNVVNGDKLAVDTLLQDPRVKAVSFVGSTPIAEYIYAEGCKHGKRVQALGGAKNHAVLMPDADVDNAVSALMGAAYGSCGERCMAIPLLVAVGDAVGDAVIAGLKTEIAKMKVGPGTDNSNDMGPLVTKPHFEKVKAYVDSGVAEGATLVVDGRSVKVRNLRPRAGRGAREDAARSHAAHQRPRIRQRHLHLHPRRRSRPLLHRPHPGWHGGRERAPAGARGLPLVWRLEAQPVWRLARLRPRCRALLHQAQDHHAALAVGGGARGGGVQLPEQPLNAGRHGAPEAAQNLFTRRPPAPHGAGGFFYYSAATNAAAAHSRTKMRGKCGLRAPSAVHSLQ